MTDLLGIADRVVASARSGEQVEAVVVHQRETEARSMTPRSRASPLRSPKASVCE